MAYSAEAAKARLEEANETARQAAGEEVYTVNNAAAMAGIYPSQLRRWAAEGRVRVVRVSPRLHFIPLSEIERLKQLPRKRGAPVRSGRYVGFRERYGYPPKAAPPRELTAEQQERLEELKARGDRRIRSGRYIGRDKTRERGPADATS